MRGLRSEVANVALQLRTGVHLGECEVRGEKVSGIEVHTAARIMAAAGAGEIVLSATEIAAATRDWSASNPRKPGDDR